MKIGTSRMAGAERISRTSAVFFTTALGDQSNKIRSGTLWAIASIEGYRRIAISNPKRLATRAGAVSLSESVTTTATFSLMVPPRNNRRDYPVRFLCETSSLVVILPKRVPRHQSRKETRYRSVSPHWPYCPPLGNWPQTAFGEVPEDWGTLSRHRDLNSVICTSRTANERHARGLQFPAPRLHETDPPDRLSKIDGRDPAL